MSTILRAGRCIARCKSSSPSLSNSSNLRILSSSKASNSSYTRIASISCRRPFYSSSAGETDSSALNTSIFHDLDTFPRRHIGPSPSATKQMLETVSAPNGSLDAFVKQVVPESVLSDKELNVKPENGYSESEVLERLREIAGQNKMVKSFIGAGYYGTKVPEVIKRNILECPEWYTSYTPYQPEISQGRLESLLNFQTMVTSLTGMQIANASILDELTAAAEAMTFSYACLPSSRQKRKNKTFLVSHLVHPQTIAGLSSRADGFDIKVVVKDIKDTSIVKEIGDDLIGVLIQYPDTLGVAQDWYGQIADAAHEHNATVCVATDLLALTLLKPPGEWGADIALGTSQRFGVPMGYGGPHAAFFATTDKHKRKLPGRLIGVSKDKNGDKAYRLALQTREQHIRREKATSNICTAQALLANMSAMYAVYHGPDGLKKIAQKVLGMKAILAESLRETGLGDSVKEGTFDTIVVETSDAENIVQQAEAKHNINLRLVDSGKIGISIDEATRVQDLISIITALSGKGSKSTIDLSFLENIAKRLSITSNKPAPISEKIKRTTPFLQHTVFNSYHSETEMLRYIHHLQSKDLSLAHSMIPLGSCTMKLNATTEMLPVTWPEFASLHPFAPVSQAQGYATMIQELEADLADITGFDSVSLQPNSGAQGEFTGLRVIREYFKSKGEAHRDTILIPVSAHGTNPASAAMVGCKVVSIKCDNQTGNLDIKDLEDKAKKHADNLAGIMITYPSTFGVFEPEIVRACEIVHENGGQVYMDGANMNAQIGLTSPGHIGADVCHLNLHKTFCIPHGGGGPGVGPIGVAAHLTPFLPTHPLIPTGGKDTGIPPVSAAPWGSASILPISWAYIKMMGAKGLTHATKLTILNANYMATRLSSQYEILYTNSADRCAHEFILDVRPFKQSAGIEAIDIAKRLMDYGFHAPTMSWPVPNTLMVEPTESESKEELDRFCDALLSIREEIREIEEGKASKDKNVLKNSPHTMKDLAVSEQKWAEKTGENGYSREKAGWPLNYLKERKFWPSVGRIDDAYGDQNLFCTCDPVEDTDSATVITEKADEAQLSKSHI